MGDGRCNVSDSQEWAQAAVLEGAASLGTLGWASIGSGGTRANNAERDLFRWLNLEQLMQIDPDIIWLPRNLKNQTDLQYEPTAILAPHEVMHMISCQGDRQWLVSMLGPDLQDGVDEF